MDTVYSSKVGSGVTPLALVSVVGCVLKAEANIGGFGTWIVV
jgi:hypothetical protein